MVKKCELCGTEDSFFTPFTNIKGKECCKSCARKYVDEAISNVIVTTTFNIDGYKVKRYIGIESIEIVIGTGIFSEMRGELSDFFGERSTGFEKKLQDAKQAAFKKLKYKAFEKDGNAVVGIDIDYTEFSGNRIGLVVNGTIVEVEQI